MWPNRTLFLGPLQQLEFHAMGAVAINVGLYQSFLMKMMNGTHEAYRCAVIPAGCKHELNAYGNMVACLVIEKNSTDFINFQKRHPFQTSTITNIVDTEWIGCFQKIYEEKPSKIEINRMINQLLDADEGTDKTADPRIASIMHTIKLDPGNDFSQEYLASSVGLSASRFRHLFREHSDIPFRRYRMWRRIILAMGTLHSVDNLTYAAMEAGFTDSAHFNHCFRDTFGVNPSLVFRNIDRFEV
jgi:AraC-like DNA-binding protein